jgi:hypothetical protein
MTKIDLHVFAPGDPAVGIAHTHWTIENVGPLDAYPNQRDMVRRQFELAFQSLADGKLRLFFSDEPGAADPEPQTPQEPGEWDVPGVEGGIAIVKRTRWGSASMELYGEDGEPFYGSLPVDTPLPVINQAMHLIQRAEKRGEEWGKRSKQFEVLKVLGIEKPFELMPKVED